MKHYNFDDATSTGFLTTATRRCCQRTSKSWRMADKRSTLTTWLSQATQTIRYEQVLSV